MPKDYFSIDNLTSLQSLPPDAHIHFIGVAGVAMGNLAIALSEKGYRVTGSDKDFYEPMGTALKESSVELIKGYAAENLEKRPDLCVIGNAISYAHPEVAVIEEQNLPYTCFPRMLYETVIAGKTSIVACGTHGKSTTTALIASALKRLKKEPSYFVGGKVKDLERSVCVDRGAVSVVEGDEYDDVFFSKRAKFMHYKPDVCIINAMEFDHADLYADFAAVKKAFYELCISLSPQATLILNADSSELEAAYTEWKDELACKVLFFGRSKHSDLKLCLRKQEGLSQTISCSYKEQESFEFVLNVPGEYNARNALATLLALHVVGCPFRETASVLSEYQGVKKRQEVRLEKNGCVLIEDFAHHPSAIKAAILSIKEAYPEKTFWAVFEPRSNTSRLNIFYDDYIEAFKVADYALFTLPVSKSLDGDRELLDVKELVADISKQGVEAVASKDVVEISTYIKGHIRDNDVVLVMSNGSFGGLVQRLVDEL